jgi:iron complex transport system substrate-binding protein
MPITRRHFVQGIAAVATAATGVAAPTVLSANTGLTQLTDVLGRSIEVRLPVKRALLGVYIEDILAVVGPSLLDRTAAMSTATWRDWKNNQWKAYLSRLPALERIPDVGEVSDKSFSIEKAIAATPDVVILAAWQVDTLGPQVERLAAAGIPVVVIDFNAQTLERHLASTRLIGRIFGAEQRAEAIAAEYETAINDIRRRVAGSGQSRRRVYLELGIKGPGEIGNTYDKAMWGPMLDQAGGLNIAKGKVGNWGPMTAEGILAAQPEVIFISGGEWTNNKAALKMGFGASATEARSVIKGFVQRLGWTDLPAVKSGQVHAVAQGMIRSLHDYTQLQFIAKTLHPEAFTDIDPEASLHAFYRRWLPVEASGLFVLNNGASA